jgi:hypothetical protein
LRPIPLAYMRFSELFDAMFQPWQSQQKLREAHDVSWRDYYDTIKEILASFMRLSMLVITLQCKVSLPDVVSIAYGCSAQRSYDSGTSVTTRMQAQRDRLRLRLSSSAGCIVHVRPCAAISAGWGQPFEETGGHQPIRIRKVGWRNMGNCQGGGKSHEVTYDACKVKALSKSTC